MFPIILFSMFHSPSFFVLLPFISVSFLLFPFFSYNYASCHCSCFVILFMYRLRHMLLVFLYSETYTSKNVSLSTMWMNMFLQLLACFSLAFKNGMKVSALATIERATRPKYPAYTFEIVLAAASTLFRLQLYALWKQTQNM